MELRRPQGTQCRQQTAALGGRRVAGGPRGRAAHLPGRRFSWNVVANADEKTNLHVPVRGAAAATIRTGCACRLVTRHGRMKHGWRIRAEKKRAGRAKSTSAALEGADAVKVQLERGARQRHLTSVEEDILMATN